MVGVAGRSKACGHCRRRRVKCDEGRPGCQRCFKAKLDCDGYRDMTVIQYNGETKHSMPLRTPSSSQSPKNLTEVLSFNSQSPKESTEITPFEDIIITPWMSIAPLADDVYVNYTISHLLRGGDHTASKGLKTILSDECFLALATSYFGNEHKEQKIIQRGFQRYGTALRNLHHALGDREKHASYDLLEAVIVMAFFEYLMADTVDGWIGHSVGLEKLMKLRGPQTFRGHQELTAFQTSRLTIIFASIVLHKTTILSESAWKSVPWELNPENKKPFQYLVDLLAECPKLFVLKDQMLASTDVEEKLRLATTLWQEAVSILSQVDIWKVSWDIVEPNSWTESPTNDQVPTFESANGSRTPYWTTNLIFQSLEHANAITICNGGVILLLKIMAELSSDPTLPFEPPVNLQERMYSAGIDICRSVDYHTQMSHAGLGSFWILFPLRMAWDGLGKYCPEVGSWLKVVLHNVQNGTTGRWSIARTLLHINSTSNTRVTATEDSVIQLVSHEQQQDTSEASRDRIGAEVRQDEARKST